MVGQPLNSHLLQKFTKFAVDNAYIAIFVCPGFNTMLGCLQSLNPSRAAFSRSKPTKTLEKRGGSQGQDSH